MHMQQAKEFYRRVKRGDGGEMSRVKKMDVDKGIERACRWDGWMDKWKDKWMDEWMDGWIEGWMDGCMNGWMDA